MFCAGAFFCDFQLWAYRNQIVKIWLAFSFVNGGKRVWGAGKGRGEEERGGKGREGHKLLFNLKSAQKKEKKKWIFQDWLKNSGTATFRKLCKNFKFSSPTEFFSCRKFLDEILWKNWKIFQDFWKILTNFFWINLFLIYFWFAALISEKWFFEFCSNKW